MNLPLYRLRTASRFGVLLPLVVALPVVAGIATAWNRDEVVPVVIVKPGISGFVPVEGNSIGNTWAKSEVKAVLLLKPGVGGFVPRNGSSIGNMWSKGDVIPVMLVEPSAEGYVLLKLLDSSEPMRAEPAPTTATPSASDTSNATTEPEVTGRAGSGLEKLEDVEAKLADTIARLAPAGDGPSFIESRINGEFTGWEGDTILKLENGQIWEQVGYAYTYRYVFRPKVYFIKYRNAYKMKVEGVTGTIFVRRLR